MPFQKPVRHFGWFAVRESAAGTAWATCSCRTRTTAARPAWPRSRWPRSSTACASSPRARSRRALALTITIQVSRSRKHANFGCSRCPRIASHRSPFCPVSVHIEKMKRIWGKQRITPGQSTLQCAPRKPQHVESCSVLGARTQSALKRVHGKYSVSTVVLKCKACESLG